MNAKATRLAAKREEILAAASLVFANEGYETTSMDRVAEEAKASKRTVYNHFGSKEALFEAVVGQLLDRWRETKNEIVWDAERPLTEQLSAFARLKAAMTEDPTSLALFRVSLAVQVQNPKALERVIAAWYAEEDSLERWLADAHAAGALRVDDPALAAEVFWAMASGALFWPALVGNPPESNERLVAEIADTFLARYGAS